jgi:RND family efflux transporter MFP subunit
LRRLVGGIAPARRGGAMSVGANARDSGVSIDHRRTIAIAMSEGRIIVLATLPMLAGLVWLLSLRRPDGTVRYVDAAARSAAIDAAPGTSARLDGYAGVIVSGYTAEVGTEVGGSVTEAAASVGARVRAGDPLLRIDPGSSGEDLRMARARLEQQHSAVARAQAELAEASDLVKRLETIASGVSDRSLVAARTREQQARAALNEAQAGLGIHEADIGQQVSRSKKHVIRAPFDGLVVARFVDPGGLVVPGQVVVRVITDDYFVRFAMTPEDARARSSGFHVHVEVPGATAPIAGVVSDIQPEIDASAQMVFARARLELGPTDIGFVIPGVRVQVRPAPAQPGGGGG